MKNDINKLYTEIFNEDKRLSRSQASKIEYLTNTKYILDELEKGDTILELGAATGAYTMMLAEKGFNVTALEYVEKNLDVLKSKIQEHHNVTPILGDAFDLSQFEDESFDCVLNMGPLYHFPNEEDRDTVVRETLRVLKKGGTAFFAFIGNDMVFVTESLLYTPSFLDGEYKYYGKESHKVVDIPFTVLTVNSIKELMKKHKCKEHKFIASDGYAELLEEHINKLSTEKFNRWLEYHFYMCEKPEILGASHHLLYITKK